MKISVNLLKYLILATYSCWYMILPISAETEPADLSPNWENINENLQFGKIGFYPENSFLRSELYLLKFNLNNYRVELRDAKSLLKKQKGLIKDFVESQNAIAGINANFFDPLGKPLGLIISSHSQLSNKIQNGGKLLNGIFYVKDNLPKIVLRENFNPDKVSLAFQAGPVMHLNKLPIKFTTPSQTSRRSGIAITSKGDIVLFATLLRFPGTSLEDTQKVLSRTGLDISDSLNLDGGSSSQFFIRAHDNLTEEISISGGDEVPTGLLVLNK